MRFKDFSIQFKILFFSISGIIALAVFITFFYIKDINNEAHKAILEKSRAVVFTAEASRQEMANKIKQGVVMDLETIAERDDKTLLLNAVPVITAINIARMNSENADYEFRVPKNNPRNPENTPDLIEAQVLKEFEETGKDIIIKKDSDSIRYFRPIKLTEECMLCHGDPAGELDPLGGVKEGWKVGEIHGAFEVISSLDQAKKTTAKAFVTISILTFLVVFILSFLLWWVIRWVTNPLKDYISNFEKASNGDLRVSINVDSNDEVGKVSVYFNSFIKSLSLMINHLKDVSDNTREVSDSLATTSEETAASLEEIRVNTENMQEKTIHLDGEIGTSKNSADEIRNYVSELVELISNQSEALSKSSSSIEEISANIQNISLATETKLQLTRELEDRAQNGENEMDETTNVIRNVAGSAQTILDMITVIQNIASTTDLLAMNAAIEAAHAGEAGKGFAVVADEIRNLAVSSNESAKEIGKSLQEVNEYIKFSEESIERTSAIFHSIVKGINDVSLAMQEMNHSTDELTIGNNQILESLTALIEITGEVRNSAEDINVRIDRIVEAMDRVSVISNDTKNGMHEVKIGIEEIHKAGEVISESGHKNQDNISILQKAIDKFIVDKD